MEKTSKDSGDDTTEKQDNTYLLWAFITYIDVGTIKAHHIHDSATIAYKNHKPSYITITNASIVYDIRFIKPRTRNIKKGLFDD